MNQIPDSLAVPTKVDERYTIKTAAEVMGVSPEYVRTLIRAGRLITQLEAVDGLSKVKRHTITQAELLRFMSEPERRGTRNGRRRYILRMTDEQVERLQWLMHRDPTVGDVEIERAFKPRTDETDYADPDQDQA